MFRTANMSIIFRAWAIKSDDPHWTYIMIKDLTTSERNIFTKLHDNKSQQVFIARQQYAKSKKTGLFWELFEKSPNYQELVNRLSNNKYFMYGGGQACSRILDVLKRENCVQNCTAILDKNSSKKEIEQIPVVNPTQLNSTQLNSTVIAVVSLSKYNTAFGEVIEYLKKLGFAYTNIVIGYDLYANTVEQYFDEQIIIPKLTPKEIFADIGCCDFSTSLRLLEICGDAEKIYAFEPSALFQEKCRNAIKNSGYDKCVFSTDALWNINTQLAFGPDMFTDFKVLKVNASKFDDIVGSNVTFIKMDIEGAELNALKGCSNSIVKYKPKLAISIYHKEYDYIEIPEFILSLNPNYKLYIRHYTAVEIDSVLYAV